MSLLVLFLTLVVAFGALVAPERIENRLAPRATVESNFAGGDRTPEQTEYLDGLSPLLDVLVGEGQTLARLADERSRDIVELTLRMNRYQSAAEDVEQYVRDHSTPRGLEHFVSELQRSIADSLAAIDSSIEAVRRFDWNALAVGVAAFSTAVNEITVLAGTPAPSVTAGR